MKICAIISEYNPLHYGHLHHIADAKIQSGADAVMVIMGGNFTQRGEPAIVNKYVRARMALEAGADIVVQLPTVYACSTAEIFALAGVKIANSFKNVTHIAFGCETTNDKVLTELAQFFLNEPKEFKTLIKKHLETGDSLVMSKSKAIKDLIDDNKLKFSNNEEVTEILRKPNNILAIEYLKSLKLINSKIKPVFTNRIDNYHDEKVHGVSTSATAIRATLYSKHHVTKVKKLMPKFSYQLLKEEYKAFGFPNQTLFNNFCLLALKSTTPEELKKVFDVTEGLENRFIEFSKRTKDLNELLLNVKTKRYTFTRLKRIVLSLLLKINEKTVKEIYNIDVLPFVKVLAFKQENADLLKKVDSTTNLILRVNNVEKEQSALYKELANIEDRATQIYNLLLTKNKAIPDYTPDLLTKSIKL